MVWREQPINSYPPLKHCLQQEMNVRGRTSVPSRMILLLLQIITFLHAVLADLNPWISNSRIVEEDIELGGRSTHAVNWVPTCCALTVILEAPVAMTMAIRMAMRVAIPVIRTDMAEEMWDNFLASYKLLIWVPVWLGKTPWFGVTWWALMHGAWRKDNLQPNMGSYNDANVQQNMGLAGALEADMEYLCRIFVVWICMPCKVYLNYLMLYLANVLVRGEGDPVGFVGVVERAGGALFV